MGLRDRGGTIKISVFSLPSVMAGLLCLCLSARMMKMMNCIFSSHTYGSVLIFQRNKQNQPEDPDSLFILKAWRVLKWTDFDKLF